MDWFNVLDKKTSSNSDFLGWMERQQNISSSTATTGPFIPIMAAHHHQQSHPYPPFLGDDDGGGGGGSAGGGAGVVGPTNKSGGDSGAAVSIYRDQVPSQGGGGAGAEDFVNNTTILQPFDYSSTHYKSPGGGMAARDYPFTGGQWKELERQAMIYKCMISSVPVSPHLLFPLDSTVTSRGGRYSRKVDVEVGRCKRTDGKKWRCSREVAPLQKYCDRHLHRGRPRSRKPVELNNNNTTATAHNHNNTRLHHTKPKTPPPKSHLTISTPSYNATTNTNTNRDLGMTKQQQQQQQPWENLMGMAESDYRSTSFDPDYSAQQLLNLFSYPNLPAPEMDLPTGFIDAWTIHNRNNATAESSSISAGDLSPSLNLSMAMALGNLLDQRMSSIHTMQAAAADDIIKEDSIWLKPVGWAPFAGGGPLGEALHVSGGSNPASSYDSLSAPATAVSSPSGVLHRTLFSHSDGGSVCNSPTFSNHWYN